VREGLRTGGWPSLLAEADAKLGLVIIAAACLLAAVGPMLVPYDPFDISHRPMLPPSWDHPMGTDPLGRDVMSQLIVGTRVSLLFGAGAAGLALLVGIGVGALAGYVGGLIDEVLSRIVEIFLMIPTLFLLILVVAIFGTSLLFTAVIVGLTIWPSNARIMRAQVLSVKTRAYVTAVRGMGAPHGRVLLVHVIPNCLLPVLANSTLQVAFAILTEASLSFVGLGDPNVMSWGQMLQKGQVHIASAPWLITLPGLAIAALLTGFHLIGDSLNRVLNPRLPRLAR
jgi:peptide/nickel transport system permease protein